MDINKTNEMALAFDMSKTKVSPTKLELGTYWVLSAAPDGRMTALPVVTPPQDKGWIRVVAPGVTYERARDLLQREYAGKTIDDVADHKIRGQLAARCLLKEWGNLVIGGDPLPYTPEKAESMLTDVTWTNFLGIIEAIADRRDVLLAKEVTLAVGNSNAGSSGS